MSGRTVALRVLAGFAFAVGLFALLCSIPLPVLLPVAVAMLALGVYVWVKAPQEGFLARSPSSRVTREDIEAARRPFPATHRAGLPIADGAGATIDMKPGRFVFEAAGGERWKLPKARVSNVELMRETEVQTHLKNRPGMALLGGVTLGVVGAVVGGAMTKEERTRVVTRFVVFDYEDAQGNPATLVFEYSDAKVGDPTWQKPKLFARDFQGNRGEYAQATTHTL